MNRRWFVAPALAAAQVILAAGPASAQHVAEDDASGDARRGLDITNFVVGNRDHSVRIRAEFVADHRDEIIIAIRARKGPLSGVLAKHRATGPDRLRYFTRRATGCRGLTSVWHRKKGTVDFRFPAHCINGGNYGAVKAWMLIEPLGSGIDVDYAPEKPNGDIRFTEWVPRG